MREHPVLSPVLSYPRQRCCHAAKLASSRKLWAQAPASASEADPGHPRAVYTSRLSAPVLSKSRTLTRAPEVPSTRPARGFGDEVYETTETRSRRERCHQRLETPAVSIPGRCSFRLTETLRGRRRPDSKSGSRRPFCLSQEQGERVQILQGGEL